MSARKKALGRGLGALLGTPPVRMDLPQTKKPQYSGSPAAEAPRPGGPGALEVRFIPLSDISPNPSQPRSNFSRESLQELAESIITHGVLQPVLLTPNKGKPGFTLLAGERRFRAAELAKLREIPALISEVTKDEMLEIALVENVQRDDLNPVEEARAYRRLLYEFGYTQEQIAQRVGKNRSTIANALRLLKLGNEALEDLEAGRLTAGHARALLSVEEPFYRQKLRREIVEKGLSVREAERRAVSYIKSGSPISPRRRGKEMSRGSEQLDTVSLQERLMERLGCRVLIKSRDGRSGSVEIPFRNPDELDRFLQAIGFES